MQRADFHYELPPELIAQHPLPERTASRLLCLRAGDDAPSDLRFTNLPGLLAPEDLLVFNDTRVIPARLFGTKPTGGRVELLVERLLPDNAFLAQLRASKPPKPGMVIELEGGTRVEVIAREDDFWRLRLDAPRPLAEVLEAVGHMPLPPYIARGDTPEDAERYQTVYARAAGAVAAPTAGLHFDAPLLQRIAALGVRSARVTLHVGAGTFRPVRVDDIARHRMHAEWLEVPEATVAAVADARARGGRVVAVGTTVVRSLETAAAGGELGPYAGETRLFITPGYDFRVVDALVTNFHLPESTLLMLVCAFAGHARTLAAYRHAVERRYRFFSYGDAMFLTRALSPT